jgi:hypothetical protein
MQMLGRKQDHPAAAATEVEKQAVDSEEVPF